MTTYFKAAFLILAFCAVIILYGIYSNGKPSRFQIVGVSDHVELVDMKTMDIYLSEGEGWHKIDNKGYEVEVKELPK
jgi:hypothetical protein